MGFLDLFIGKKSQFGFVVFAMMVICLYLMYPEILDTVGNEAIAKSIIVFIALASFVFYKLFMAVDRIEADQFYTSRYWEMGSDANYNGQSAGKKWTHSGVVQAKMSAPIEKSIELDYFRFTQKVKRHLFLKWLWGRMELSPMTMNPEMLTQGSLVIGQQGAGKTEFFHNIILQSENKKLFNRMIIHDAKGDITAAWFRKKKDIIVNPYDARSSAWDFFGEANHQIVQLFFSTYLSAVAGDKKDYFSGAASKNFMEIIEQLFYKQGYTNKEKWAAFIDALDEFFKAVVTSDQRSEKDVASTMKLTFQMFALQNKLIQNGSKTFTFKSFFESSDAKLFLHNPPLNSPSLSPYFAGIVGAMTIILASLNGDKWDKSNQTFLLFDEYLTFLNVLDDKTINTLHTMIRSRGGSLMAAVQFVPENSGIKNIAQSLSNSAWAWFIFRTSDNFTKKLINDNIEKVEYQKSSQTSNTIRGSAGYSNRGNLNIQTAETNLLDGDTLSNLGYDHIAYIPSSDILYRGYTPLVKVPKRSQEVVLRKDEFWDNFFTKLYSKQERKE